MTLFGRTVCCAVLLLPLAACDQGKGDVNLDQLKIDAGRLGGVVDRATDGLDLQPNGMQQSKDPEAAKRLAIDYALRAAALKVLILRNRLLYEDVIGEKEARETQWPNWVLTPPESALSPVDLKERYAWLDAEVKGLAEHGCGIGREKSHDQNFCAVQ
jgi:hypothetical protein